MNNKPGLVRLLPPDERKWLDTQLADERHTYKDVAAALAERGYSVPMSRVRTYALYMRLRTRHRQRVNKVQKLLSPEHRTEYEAFLSDDRNSAADAVHWLQDRGYDIGAGASGNHRRGFMATLGRVRESAMLAQAMVQAGGEPGAAAMSSGMMLRCEQVLMEQFLLLDEKKKIEGPELTELCKSAFGSVAARERLEGIRKEFEEKKQIAVKAGEIAAKKGASPSEVADRVREILGV